MVLRDAQKNNDESLCRGGKCSKVKVCVARVVLSLQSPPRDFDVDARPERRVSCEGSLETYTTVP